MTSFDRIEDTSSWTSAPARVPDHWPTCSGSTPTRQRPAWSSPERSCTAVIARSSTVKHVPLRPIMGCGAAIVLAGVAVALLAGSRLAPPPPSTGREPSSGDGEIVAVEFKTAAQPACDRG